jgi:anaerobic magnesium-protoporphyrin IX monomethyl ester cyclase
MTILITNIPTQIPLKKGYEKYFIKAGSRWPHPAIKKRGEFPPLIMFPFYLAYTSSILRKNNLDVYFLDGVAENMSENDFLNAFSKIWLC